MFALPYGFTLLTEGCLVITDASLLCQGGLDGSGHEQGGGRKKVEDSDDSYHEESSAFCLSYSGEPSKSG